ncbi:MAG: hypothetical protein ACH346_08620 [Chthoniobacterales bacterium]
MKSAIESLHLDALYVICYGERKPWPLAEKISAVPAMCLTNKKWKP